MVLVNKGASPASDPWRLRNDAPGGEEENGNANEPREDRKDSLSLFLSSFAGEEESVGLLRSHHYRPFDKADKAHKECLSHRVPHPPLILLFGILMSDRDRPVFLSLSYC